MHSQGKRSKYLPNSNSQSKGIMIGKLSARPEDRIVLHVCKYEARFPYHGSGAVTRSPLPLAWRPDFPGAPREAH